MDSTGRLALLKNQKGFALVYVALIITALFGFLGLSVDVGHLYVVRGKLQNAADAAALAGAWSLYRDPSTPGVPPTLDWERARAAATNFIKENSSDLASNVSLIDGTIEVGYWNLTSKIMQSQTITPTSQDIPAVRATISRSDGSNGGPVSTFFIKILNAANDSAPVSSRPAVAVSGYPGSVTPNILFPMALSKCMTDEIFDLGPAEWPNRVELNSPYGPEENNCYSGQWTSFKLGTSDVPTIFDLMENGNPDPLAIEDLIWIQPGTEGSVFQPNKWPFPIPADVVMAIVDTEDPDNTSFDMSDKGSMKISGFATFHIDGTSATTSDKYVFGHFIGFSETYPTGINPGGPASNIVTRPLMVQ